MRFILLFILSLSTLLFAQTTVKMNKGWQLTGLPTQIDTMELFNNKKVKSIFSFNAKTQVWLGYSPQSDIQSKMEKAGYQKLSSLKPWQAFWIQSTETWSIELTSKEPSSDPNNSYLELYTGWNLVSLPSKTVISPTFFDDMTVWKYSDKWRVHSNSSLPFPTIETLSTSEGFWVKSEKDQTVDLSEKSSKLHTFDSEKEMLDYIRSMVKSHRYPYYGYLDFARVDSEFSGVEGEVSGGVPPAVPTASDDGSNSKATDTTSTNLQEEGVDESDILKHDGEYIFFVDQENEQINVTSFTNISAGEYKPLHQIMLEKGQSVSAMYLQNDRLSVISHKSRYYILEETVEQKSMIYPSPSIQEFHIDFYDVSDIDSIKLLSSTAIEGDYRESRMIDGKLILISHFYPHIEYEYPIIYPDVPECIALKKKLNELELGYAVSESVVCAPDTQCLPDKPSVIPSEYQAFSDAGCYQYSYDTSGRAWQYDYKNPIIVSEHLTPSMTVGDQDIALLKPHTFYAPYKMDQSADITTITAIESADGSYQASISFLGSTHTYYASSTSLYLVSSQYPLYYNFERFSEQQAIYQFNISSKLSYVGRGFVDGRMLNQYSMSEHNSFLRIATSSGNNWSSIKTDNSLFVLQSNADEELEIIGSLNGLGKKGETIHAVRFSGDRGYVVTFERTDPFYTLDLKDPTAPVVAGALEIPGFSEYIHPVDENRILSIGRDTDSEGRTKGLQIQLFDISDFSAPKLASKIVIGDSRTYSEAEYNPRVFAYRDSDKLFGLPYRKEYREFYFGLYQINDLKIDSVANLYEKSESKWGYSSPRGVIFDRNGATYGALFQGDHIICENISSPKAVQ